MGKKGIHLLNHEYFLIFFREGSITESVIHKGLALLSAWSLIIGREVNSEDGVQWPQPSESRGQRYQIVTLEKQDSRFLY